MLRHMSGLRFFGVKNRMIHGGKEHETEQDGNVQETDHRFHAGIDNDNRSDPDGWDRDDRLCNVLYYHHN